MTTLEAYGTGRASRIPSSWDEMEPRQARTAFRLMDSVSRGRMSPLEANVRILLSLLGVRRRWWVSRHAVEISENVSALCRECLSFMFPDGSDERVGFGFTGVSNPLPEAGRRLFGRRLAGPASFMQDLTFGEFRRAATALQEFRRTGDISDLDECIAHLYRPRCRRPNKAGRRVRPFRADRFPREVRAASRLRTWEKSMVMSWFSSCIRHMQEDKVRLDGEEADMSLLFSGGASGGDSVGWADMQLAIAKDRVIGGMDGVDDEPLWSVVKIMWMNYKEYRRNEKAFKSHKAK